MAPNKGEYFCRSEYRAMYNSYVKSQVDLTFHHFEG